jgi:hypothetical protein
MQERGPGRLRASGRLALVRCGSAPLHVRRARNQGERRQRGCGSRLDALDLRATLDVYYSLHSSGRSCGGGLDRIEDGRVVCGRALELVCSVVERRVLERRRVELQW